MKNAKKLLFTMLAFCAVAWGANAQSYLEDPRYGNSPEERKENVLTLNYFNDAYQAKNYDVAAQHLMNLLSKAPKASENMYINGGNIYKVKITQATSVAEKNAYVDTLMYIYDVRAANFGDHATRGRAYILTAKAGDYLVYKPTDREGAYKLYNDAIEATEGSDPDVINTYFNMLVEDYKMDMVETDILMEEYDRLIALFEANQSAEMQEGQKVLEALLISSGAANCENLEKLFRPRYEANPNDVELMTKIVGLMARGNCDSPFMLEVAENLYKVQPTAETGLALATIFEAEGDYEKSLYYWQESINAETNPETKATYIARAAASALASTNYREAASFARQAIEINPNNGLAYMILGQAYGLSVASSCSDSFTRQAAYWLVVDNLQKAKSLLVDDESQVESLNKQIAQYTAAWPTNEECFFRSLSSGDSYTVNCGWISGRTTVRTIR